MYNVGPTNTFGVKVNGYGSIDWQKHIWGTEKKKIRVMRPNWKQQISWRTKGSI